ncbi:conserved hypothetical protein, secreted [mine drainage metagenome]|uniref:Uncharacterized protein n=1 Tax=mine drainage metagenome TaxID=410659 RepID=T1A5P7_9ZZZZ
MTRSIRLGLGVALLLGGSALAPLALAQQTPAQQTTHVDHFTNRNVAQQQRIEQGLKSGQLTTREAAHLEQGTARIDRMQSRATNAHGAGGAGVTAAEATRIQRAQNAESHAIYNQRHDAQTGNPNSLSSRRMQGDVQRNLNQQSRIASGVDHGGLTNREVSHLSAQQARGSHAVAAAGRNGFVNGREQRRVQRGDNVRSRHIYRARHNGARRHGG